MDFKHMFFTRWGKTALIGLGVGVALGSLTDFPVVFAYLTMTALAILLVMGVIMVLFWLCFLLYILGDTVYHAILHYAQSLHIHLG